MHGDDGLRRAARALYDQTEGAGEDTDSLVAASRARVLARAERARRWRRVGEVCARGGAAALAAAMLVAGRGHFLPGGRDHDWLPPASTAHAAASGASDRAPSNENARAEPEPMDEPAPVVAAVIGASESGPERAPRAADGEARERAPRAHGEHAPHASPPRLLARATLPDVRRPTLAPLGAAAFAHGTLHDPALPPGALAFETTARMDVADLYARTLPVREHDARDARGARVLAPLTEPRIAALSPLAPAVRAGEHSNPTVTLVAWR